MRAARTTFALVLSTGLLSCGPMPNDSQLGTTPQPPGAGAPLSGQTDAALLPPAPFENPGGMWTPEQLESLAPELKRAGITIDPKTLADPKSPPLGAVVSLGGCSASFVSPDGLIITNHHCVTRALQNIATVRDNTTVTGYFARRREDEKPAGATQHVFVTQSLRDVTKEVRDNIEAIKDPVQRTKTIEARIKTLVAACEKDKPDVRCSVPSFFGGEQYRLVEQLDLKDVRLVYAPAAGIGNFGGETDNWRWPRHTGDFAFFRAYVAPSGKSATFDAANVPYVPKHFLRFTQTPLKQGDGVMVAGYPGHTNRLRTAREAEDALTWFYPRRIKFFEDYISLFESVAAKDPVLALKVHPTTRGLHNALTKYRGIVEGMKTGGLVEQKKATEAKIKQWADSAPDRKALGDSIAALDEAYDEEKKTREKDAMLSEVVSMVRGLNAAMTIVRVAAERPKPDAERESAYQQRNWERLEQELTQLDKSYDPALDKAALKLAVLRDARQPETERLGLAKLIAGTRPIAKGSKDKPLKKVATDDLIDKIFAETKIGSSQVRLDLFRKAKITALEWSSDPLVRLAATLRPLVKAAQTRDQALAGKVVLARPRFVEALRKSGDGRLAPDANGTLRVTFGTVRGYAPVVGKPPYVPFTTLAEVVLKHTGQGEFNAPPALIEAYRANRVGPYVEPSLGQVPVDFLSDLDITGGNSGSATLNGKGELVGLAFDGNYEAMASDWVFMPTITRTIHVDGRYIRWVMDAVDGADRLLAEMGLPQAL